MRGGNECGRRFENGSVEAHAHCVVGGGSGWEHGDCHAEMTVRVLPGHTLAFSILDCNELSLLLLDKREKKRMQRGDVHNTKLGDI